jgi:hypothetical protein
MLGSDHGLPSTTGDSDPLELGAEGRGGRSGERRAGRSRAAALVAGVK